MSKLVGVVLVLALVDTGLAENLIRTDRPKVRVRADATVQSPQIAELSAGEIVEKVGKKDEWYEIILPDGTTGWVNSYLMLDVNEISTQDIDIVSEDTLISEKGTTPLLKLEEGLQRHPYAEGLEYEKHGDFHRALTYFEQVLDDEPGHIKSLLHASEAHIELEQFQEAREKLYRALEQGEGAQELSRLYKGLGWPDSARKYEMIAKGEDWIFQDQTFSKSSITEIPVYKEWESVIAAVVISFMGTLLLVLFIWRKKRGRHSRERGRLYSKFSSALKDASMSPNSGDGEIRELDRRIAEKREALRANSKVYSETVGSDLDEKDLANSVDSQLKALVNMLQAQDERAQIYVELNRLQMEKIKEMEREIDLLRGD
ncbi:MAG: SH3 domain-containing protein [Candidatus Latescibacterota bacterium]|nr:SH3 domain-containing protein [Candidatus Latescibacterota bacterium]